MALHCKKFPIYLKPIKYTGFLHWILTYNMLYDISSEIILDVSKSKRCVLIVFLPCVRDAGINQNYCVPLLNAIDRHHVILWNSEKGNLL